MQCETTSITALRPDVAFPTAHNGVNLPKFRGPQVKPVHKRDFGRG